MCDYVKTMIQCFFYMVDFCTVTAMYIGSMENRILRGINEFISVASMYMSIDKARTYITSSCIHFRDIKISEISEKLYVNSSYLSVIFKEEYGITLEQYLIIRKIAEAKKYLYMGVPVN